MGWLFVQVWLLCVVSFLLGAVVTWLLWVLPARRVQAPPAGRPWTLGPSWTGPPPPSADAEPSPPPPAGTRPGPPVDPALAGLDSRAEPPPAGLGTAATGALDLLGVRDRGERSTAPRGTAPVIPTQAGPADAPPPDGRPPAR